jgi:hypothetical protein
MPIRAYMGSTRAVFASIGVSVSLVAAAALSLFAVSVVIAFGGWSAGMGGSEPATTLVFSTATSAAHAAHAKAQSPVVLKRAEASRPRRAAKPAARAVAQSGSHAHATVSSQPSITQALPKPAAVQAPPATGQSAVHIPATGEGVRRVGDDLSSKVQSTGKALADVTAPLGPPVGAAVQKVLDLVAALLQRTTNALGGTLDAVGTAGSSR